MPREKLTNLPTPTDLKVHTKCPEKWLLIDRETGEMYRGCRRDARDPLRDKHGDFHWDRSIEGALEYVMQKTDDVIILAVRKVDRDK